MIVNLFSRNPSLTLRQEQVKLKQKGLDISHVTIRTHLRAHGMKWRSTIKKLFKWTTSVKTTRLGAREHRLRF